MNERTLHMYFMKDIDAEQLHKNLSRIHGTTALVKDKNLHHDLDADFLVTSECITKLCNDFLCGVLNEADIEAVALFLMASDHFFWDCNTKDGAMVSEIINIWNNADISFPITTWNMRMILRGLYEGVFDDRTLKG